MDEKSEFETLVESRDLLAKLVRPIHDAAGDMRVYGEGVIWTPKRLYVRLRSGNGANLGELHILNGSDVVEVWSAAGKVVAEIPKSKALEEIAEAWLMIE